MTLAILKNKKFRTDCVRDCITSATAKNATYEHYGITKPADNQGQNQTCELDHVVPLEMGGADSLDNIWPQCGPDSAALNDRFFKQKDLVENYLTTQVKNGSMDLAEAQEAIAKDWTQFRTSAKTWCAAHKCSAR
ncbi:MAG TPA: HNH endonuclease signature motif containing protein, partial [Bryobacteraceae bacterium]|jgi:hypothetical protein